MMLPWSWILTLDESEWIQVNKKFYIAFLGISKGIFKVEIPKNANLFCQNYIDNASKAHIGICFCQINLMYSRIHKNSSSYFGLTES